MFSLINVNVLLIEDSIDSIEVTKGTLNASKSTNFSIDVVSTLADAIKVLRYDNNYDVIILDLVLPNGEGLSVFKQVKMVTDKPIVIISGYEDKALECVKHGAQDYLVKPYYDTVSLTRSIRYAIERHGWEEKYKKLVESTHAAIYEIDFVNNCFTYVNEVALKEMGYTKQEMLNMKPIDFLCPESFVKWMERLSKIQMGDDIDPIEEYQVKKKNGSFVWILITAEYKYENGFIVGASVVAIDITEKKIKENQIRSIYKTAPVGIGLVKDDRIIVEANDRLCQMLGYKKEELICKKAKNLYLTENEYNRVGRKYKKLKEDGYSSIETQFRKKTGDVIDVLLTSTYLDESDPSKGVTFSVLDITETKESEREIEKELHKRLDVWKSEVGVDVQNLNKLDTVLSL